MDDALEQLVVVAAAKMLVLEFEEVEEGDSMEYVCMDTWVYVTEVVYTLAACIAAAEQLETVQETHDSVTVEAQEEEWMKE